MDTNNQSHFYSAEELANTEILIGEGLYDGFELKATGECFMNQSQIGSILNKEESTPRKFFESKTFKAMYGKGLEPRKAISSLNKKMVLIDTKAVSCFILNWAINGDKLAAQLSNELMVQNLDLRIKSNLRAIEDKEIVEVLGQRPDRLQERKEYRYLHGNFQGYCNRKGWVAAKVHDATTLLNFGITAEDAKKYYPKNPKLTNKHQGVDNYGPYMIEFIKLTLAILTSYKKEDEKAIEAIKRASNHARQDKGEEFCIELDKEIEAHKEYEELVRGYEAQVKKYNPRSFELTEEAVIERARQLADDLMSTK